MSLIIKRDKTIPAGIVVLLFSGGPTTIRGLVMAVIVDTIKRFSFWRQSHVCKKVLKLVPTTANFNPLFAVMLKRGITWIVATLKHRCPSMINCGFAHPVRFYGDSANTTTRNYFSSTKMGFSDSFYNTAITTAEKILIPVSVGMRIGDYRKLPETCAISGHAYI